MSPPACSSVAAEGGHALEISDEAPQERINDVKDGVRASEDPSNLLDIETTNDCWISSNLL